MAEPVADQRGRVETYQPCPMCADRGCPKCDPGITEVLRRTGRLPSPAKTVAAITEAVRGT